MEREPLNIFKQARELMDASEIDHYRADLYLKVTPVSVALVGRYPYKGNVTTFRDQIDGEQWFDIPFAYAPAWEKGLGYAD